MKRILLFVIFLVPVLLNAQQQLTLKGAIDTALKNNFDIRIAKNNVEIAKINNAYGMAGGLPTISVNAADNVAVNDINQEYSGGTEINLSNINENSIKAGINASMVLFNGFKVIATKERLNSLQKQSELSLNLEIQNAIAAIMIKYYDILRQQSYFKIIQNSLDVSNKKLQIIDEKNKVGMANAVDILQAQMDVNIAEQNLKAQQLVIDEAKADLLLLMNAKKNLEYSINDSIVVDETLQQDSIINFLNRNPEFLSAEQQIKINEQMVRELSAQRYPSIKINTAYDFAHTDNSSGSLLMNQNYGPSAGITLQIPIFNGSVYNKQRKAALLNMENSKLEKESLLNTLSTDAIKTYNSYSTTLSQLKVQQTNYTLAQKLVEVVMQNFKLNQATILDVKAAQTSFESAGYFLVNLQYAAKTAEIQLKQLNYSLGY